MSNAIPATSKIILLTLVLGSVSISSAQATISIGYQQSANLWNVLTKVRNGVSDADSANALLNETYGQPVGDEISITYRPERFYYDAIQLREIRVDQLAYAVSSNPVLPELFGWVGAGASATYGFHFLEVYGGRYFAKRANAVSTDLIDHRLVNADELTLLGIGFHEAFHVDSVTPLDIELYTRHTDFISSATDSHFYHRWKIEIDASTVWASPFLILGQNPVPGYEQNGPVWDYLWQIDAFPQFMSVLGVGVKSPILEFAKIQGTVGFFGGYIGAKIESHFLPSFSIDLHSFGLETTSAYQARCLRLWGGNLSYLF